MLYQLGALIAIAKAEGVTVSHISFHAAMGNMVNRDTLLADLMMDAIATVDAGLVVFVTHGSEIQQAAKRARLKTLALFLADRAYDAGGKLVVRGLPGAVIKDEAAVRARVRQFLLEGTVETIDGAVIAMLKPAPFSSTATHPAPSSLLKHRARRNRSRGCRARACR